MTITIIAEDLPINPVSSARVKNEISGLKNFGMELGG
jgi:hypothetical protein